MDTQGAAGRTEQADGKAERDETGQLNQKPRGYYRGSEALYLIV